MFRPGAGHLGPGSHPAISIDGRYVAFLSPGSVHVRDRVTGMLTTVAPASRSIVNSPGVSAGGRHVVFISDEALVPADTNELADIYRVSRT